jgi:hypothetical protein
VVVRQREDGVHRVRAIDEQPPRVNPHDGLEVVGRVRSGERAQRPHLLALDREPLTARRQDAHARRVAQHRGDEPGSGIEQMLAVVEDQEQALGTEELDDAILDRAAGRSWTPAAARHLTIASGSLAPARDHAIGWSGTTSAAT